MKVTQLEQIQLHDGLERVLIDEKTLSDRIDELCVELTDHYDGKNPLLIGVLTGAYMLMSDISRNMRVPLEIEFMSISSYGQATVSSGVVRILKDLNESIEGRHVLVVEDIIDSGLTLRYLLDNLQRRGPASLEVVSLLRKQKPEASEVPVKWVGFDIPDEFVVGYGLDKAGQYRNLPFIGVATAS